MNPHHFTLSAGPHARRGGLARVPWPSGDAPGALSVGGEVVAAQRDGEALALVAPPMEAGEERTVAASDEAPQEGGAVALEDDGRCIRVTLDGEEFTTYRYGDVPARPYFWPVLAPGGVPVTRAWPMEPEAGPPEARDHPHHRSLYVAFGSVNGVDNWSEEAGHGFTRHRSVDALESGPVFGRLATTSDWTDAEGRPLLEQRLTVTFWGVPTPLPVGPPMPQAHIGGDIGRYLIAKGYLTRSEFEHAWRLAREQQRNVADVLTDLGYTDERTLTEARAQEMGLPFVDLDRHAPDQSALQEVPAHIAARHNVLPVKLDPHTQTLYVAMADLTDPTVMGALRRAALRKIRPVLAEPNSIRRAIRRVYGAAGTVRVMDVDLRLTASHGEVRFGDTKEGGLLTVRVAADMAVAHGAGGRITNAYGAVNEAEAWGRAAHWCDYSGVVEGKPVGIAVMDHPDSFRHPTYWHVRDYGLMAANPFGLSDFTGGVRDGSHTLPAGEMLRFVYRVLVHAGSAEDADMRGRYLDFVVPPVLRDEG